MTDETYTPEEFARLMALPEDHPDRRRAAASPRFEAARRMLAEFERPGDALLTAREISAASALLASRLRNAGALFSRPAPDAQTAETPPSSRRKDRAGLLGWLTAPGARTALAFACAMIVAGLGWWSMHPRPPIEAMRGTTEPGAFEVTTLREKDALVLSWKAVAGADAYRIVFLGADLGEAAHLDASNATRFVLRADRLPAGIVVGAPVSLEIVALRDGAALATTPARTVLLP